MSEKRYICLRDDDTGYFTRPEELINAYGEFWGEVPITLATVPFSHGSQLKVLDFEKYGKERDYKHREWVINADSKELTTYHTVHPIGANQDLVSMLKPLVSKGLVEIAQHGVHHAYNERGPEMFCNETGYEAIRDGKEYLEKVFDTKVVTFVPPSNTIDVTCVGYLKRLGLHLFSSGTIVKDNSCVPTHDFHSILESAKRRILGIPPKPMKRNYGVMQFGSHTLGINSDDERVFCRIKKDLNDTGFSGLGTHYLIFNKDNYRSRYLRMLHRLQDELNAEFVTAKDFYRLILNEYYA